MYFSLERLHYATFHPFGIFRNHWLSMFTFLITFLFTFFILNIIAIGTVPGKWTNLLSRKKNQDSLFNLMNSIWKKNLTLPKSFAAVTTQFIIIPCIFFKGGVHTFVVSDSTEEPKLLDFLLTKENSVHMLWLIPQFFVITVGEILFSITALEFSYSQVCI